MKNEITDLKLNIESLNSIYYTYKEDNGLYIQVIQEVSKLYSWVCSQIKGNSQLYDLNAVINNNAAKIIKTYENNDIFGLVDVLWNETREILDIILELIEE